LPFELSDLLARRSVSPRRLVEPGPDPQQIIDLIEVAAAAPDHRRLQPWRFISVHKASRERLADLFEAAARELHGSLDKDGLIRAREKAANGACLIAVIAKIRPDVPDVPVHEQWVSVGAAVQNILLGAMSLGYGAMIVSGDKVGMRSLRDGLGLSSQETLLGFIAIGTPKVSAKLKMRPNPGDILSW